MDNTQITVTYAGQEPRAHLAFVEFYEHYSREHNIKRDPDV